MSNIRKAHSVEIIDRRLRQLEVGGDLDAMDLVGLHDELSRVERKWLEKAERLKTGGVNNRPLPNVDDHNARFERLSRLVEAALRRNVTESPERKLLERVGDQLKLRRPIGL